ncbi:MAG: GNAT family N-acetyltransferase [Chloroflexota bacterium]
MSLFEKRQAIRHLLDEQMIVDGLATFFAFHYDESKTTIVTMPEATVSADGYVAFSRTGMDLFRPFVTMRLPMHNHELAAQLVYSAIPEGTAVIMNIPTHHFPLIQAFFDIQTEERLKLYVLSEERPEPIINVLVTEDKHPNGYPRFLIRANDDPSRPVGAAAGLNWLGPKFAEIAVNTNPSYRRRGWGKSVVSSMVQYVLRNGREPIYAVSDQNSASIQLAESVGFVDSGVQQYLLQATLRPNPLG